MIMIGLPLVIGLVYWSNRNNPSQELTGVIASVRFAEDFPAFRHSEVIVADDCKTAFLVSDSGVEVGLVHQIGQNYLTRMLVHGSVKGVKDTGNGIDLYVNDFTLKKISVPVSNKAKRELIVEILC